MYRTCLERFSVYVECIEVDFQNHGIGQRSYVKTLRPGTSLLAVGYSPHLEPDFYVVALLAHVPGTRITLGRIGMTINHQPYRNSLATLQRCDKRPENNLRRNVVPCRLLASLGLSSRRHTERFICLTLNRRVCHSS